MISSFSSIDHTSIPGFTKLIIRFDSSQHALSRISHHGNRHDTVTLVHTGLHCTGVATVVVPVGSGVQTGTHRGCIPGQYEHGFTNYPGPPATHYRDAPGYTQGQCELGFMFQRRGYKPWIVCFRRHRDAAIIK